jgi:2-oxo-3-hexenedioate decarboxylase
MPLKANEIQKLARILDRALLDGEEVDRLTSIFPDLSLPDAYLVQEEGIRMREGRGEKQMGLKMGFTSKAKREQMGLHLPICGVLTDRMRVADGGDFTLDGSIHPKIEPEIAFHVARDLEGKVTLEQALDACSGACAALEILDSRFVGFKYFSLPDVVADNCSSSHFVLGTESPAFKGLDLKNLKMVMEVNGKQAASAISSDISGHPGMSLVQLCELLSGRGLRLKAGTWVLAGAATAAVALEPGMKVSLNVEGLGTASVSCSSGS